MPLGQQANRMAVLQKDEQQTENGRPTPPTYHFSARRLDRHRPCCSRHSSDHHQCATRCKQGSQDEVTKMISAREVVRRELPHHALSFLFGTEWMRTVALNLVRSARL